MKGAMSTTHPALQEFRSKGEAALAWLTNQLRAMRAGVVSPAMVDHIKVDAYGNPTPLSHLASITTEGARTLRVVVWDQTLVSAVAKVLRESDLGFSIAEDEKGVRATLPELTGELREKLVKQVRATLEEARIRVRQARDDAKEAIVEAQRKKELSEEDKFRLLEALQKEVDRINALLEETAKAKEAEIQA